MLLENIALGKTMEIYVNFRDGISGIVWSAKGSKNGSEKNLSDSDYGWWQSL